MPRQHYVYILSSPNRRTYTGVTNNLTLRLWQHRNGEGSEFVQRYNIRSLVHYEIYADAYTAITREKQIKSWSREKKIDLIQRQNPDFLDLSAGWKHRP